jgi:hypothetical protein
VNVVLIDRSWPAAPRHWRGFSGTNRYSAGQRGVRFRRLLLTASALIARGLLDYPLALSGPFFKPSGFCAIE